MVSDSMVLGDILMALFAFPRALKNSCYLFKYSGHFMSDGKLVTNSLQQTVCDNRATRCLLDPFKRRRRARVPFGGQSVVGSPYSVGVEPQTTDY